MVDGKIVPGNRLGNVAITITGNQSFISDKDGNVSFAVPNSMIFSLEKATKKDYTLADPDAIKRQWTYSAQNPFIVVMEKEDQRAADLNEATFKVRRSLDEQLQKSAQELELLKKKSLKEYQKKLQELNDAQEKAHLLVRQMAEHYVSTDWDLLDDFNRQIQTYIEEGELQRADSLIKSKGSLEKRAKDYQQIALANKAERERLEKSEAGAANIYDDLSKDLFNTHLIYLQQYKQDSALYCLKIRADLDTTNIDACWAYADLCHKQGKFREAEKYFTSCLCVAERAKRSKDFIWAHIHLGAIAHDLHEFESAENHYLHALDYSLQLFNQHQDEFRYLLASVQTNLGLLYMNLQQFHNSEVCYTTALNHFEKLFDEDPDNYRESIASTQLNLGVLYHVCKDLTNSEKYLQSALYHFETLAQQDPVGYKHELAQTQNNLAILYCDKNDLENGRKYYQLALEIDNDLFAQNPGMYREPLALDLNNLGTLYDKEGDNENSEKYYQLALSHYEVLFAQTPEAYRELYSLILCNLGKLYSRLGNYEESEQYYIQSLENREILFAADSSLYRKDLAESLSGMGTLYFGMENYEKAEKCFLTALRHKEILFKELPEIYRSSLAIEHDQLGNLYGIMEKYDLGNQHLSQAISHYKILYAQDKEQYFEPLVILYLRQAACYILMDNRTMALETLDNGLQVMPYSTDLHHQKGILYLEQNEIEKALEMYQKVLELDPEYFANFPDSELHQTLLECGLISDDMFVYHHQKSDTIIAIVILIMLLLIVLGTLFGCYKLVRYLVRKICDYRR